MNNCIVLPIEADSQDTALRIFNTLNDRGLPLSDSDIFKSQLYKYYSSNNKKDIFIEDWRELEQLCGDIFRSARGTPMDELFTRYMYFERAKQGKTDSTTEALRTFYEGEDKTYKLLKQDSTFENLKSLADFWRDVQGQNSEKFSDEVLRRLFVLNNAPNGMWTYLVSVYFMQNRDLDGKLDDKLFLKFLSKITAFIWTYALTNPGVGSLRSPVFRELKNIVDGKEVSFNDYRFEEKLVRNVFENYRFGNSRPITKSMLAWWAFQNSKQELIDIDSVFEIEHIYARRRHKKDRLSDDSKLESLGNKSLLEKNINIRTSDYRFSDKVSYYQGTGRKKRREPTKIAELLELAEKQKDFTEADIDARQKKIVDTFIGFLKQNALLK